jgi:ribosomal 50S subunit-associated protein YjgA (DUF615 family)
MEYRRTRTTSWQPPAFDLLLAALGFVALMVDPVVAGHARELTPLASALALLASAPLVARLAKLGKDETVEQALVLVQRRRRKRRRRQLEPLLREIYEGTVDNGVRALAASTSNSFKASAA